jgi:hypothetical protein
MGQAGRSPTLGLYHEELLCVINAGTSRNEVLVLYAQRTSTHFKNRRAGGNFLGGSLIWVS